MAQAWWQPGLKYGLVALVVVLIQSWLRSPDPWLPKPTRLLKPARMIEMLRAAIPSVKSWVLFENGTCVLLPEPGADLTVQAKELLQRFGVVHAGSSSGDFGVITLKDYRGWIVTSDHPQIVTLVGPEERRIRPDANEELIVGLYGRTKRGKDAERLRVVHVEDGRQVEASPPEREPQPIGP